MIIPSVMFIEMGLGALKARDIVSIERQSREFNSLGPARMQGIIDKVGAEGQYSQLLTGYLIGIETVRAILFANRQVDL